MGLRPHEYSSEFGEGCAAEPCVGAAIKAPSGVGVEEAAGLIAVVDRGEGALGGRVVRFDQAGSFDDELKGPNATGTGTLSEASKVIEAAIATTGAFSIGEEITAAGLPPETKITAVQAGGILEVSNPVEAGKSQIAAELKAQQNFERPEGIAVDNSCVLRKLSEAKLTLGECEAADPSNEDFYVVDAGAEHPREHSVIDKFSAAGEYLGQIREAGEGGAKFEDEGLAGVAVEPSGALWIYRERPEADGFSNANPNVFKARVLLGQLGPSHSNGFAAPGFAVDSKGNFYGSLQVGSLPQITKWGPGGNVLIESLDGEGSTGVAVEQLADASLVDSGTSIGVFGPEGNQLERLGEEHGEKHLKAGTGIGVDASTTTLYVADAASGKVIVFGPAQASVPKVEGQSLSDVGAEGASIAAEINPRSEVGDAPTEYHFQYGRCATLSSCSSSGFEASIPVPDGQIAADFEVHSVAVRLEGLTPGTTYHFRAIAKNSHGEGEAGAEVTFTTEAGGGELALPDNRGWELVSPPDKQGARIAPIAEFGVVQAAGTGGAITYLANTPTEAQPQGYSNEVQVLSRRGTAAWSSRDIAIAHAGATGKAVGEGPEYKFFDPELNSSAVQPFGEFNPELSAAASESTAYLHELSETCGAACYRPLVTGKAGFANVPAGTIFGEERCFVCGPQFLGASDDLSHVVLSANAALTPGAATLGGLYRWAEGALAPVSVLPDGGAVGESALGLGSHAARGAISADGTRIAWERNETLYLRDMERKETVQLDAAQVPTGEGTLEKEAREANSGGGHFQVASADGSRVLFTDQKPLSGDSGAAAHKADLYECVIVLKGGELACELSDLTPKRGSEAAEVQGAILGASKDATTVYFVAKGLLSQAPNARGEKAKAGQPNLYVHREGQTEYITTLSGEDEHDWAEELFEQPTRVSSDGRFLELMSQGRPTGYDNRERGSESGEAVAEVYLYDAEAKHLACASCEPSGARPLGVEYHKLEPGSGGLVGGGRETWQDTGLVAANVPGWTQIKSADPRESRYQPRYLNDSGRLFFNSINALVPQDANGNQDVYEYEPPEVGNCGESSPTYSARSGGCVSLISSGRSAQESAFLDASESGDDAFFLTSAQLSPIDTDSSRDVYDAHTCTSASPCISYAKNETPPCSTEASCKVSPTPQPAIFGAPASATFSGAGNLTPPPAPPVKKETKAQKLAKALKACHAKKNKHKRQACEKAARKKYGAKVKKTKKKAKAKKRGHQ